MRLLLDISTCRHYNVSPRPGVPLLRGRLFTAEDFDLALLSHVPELEELEPPLDELPEDEPPEDELLPPESLDELAASFLSEEPLSEEPLSADPFSEELSPSFLPPPLPGSLLPPLA